MLKKNYKSIKLPLFIYFFVSLSLVIFPKISVYSQSDPECPAHSHWDGSQCVCDSGYMVPSGKNECVPLSQVCPANSHLEGNQCFCNSGYGNKNGVCVPLSEFCSAGTYYYDGKCVQCAQNSHYIGEGKCHADEGYIFYQGKAVSVTWLCTQFNAVYDPSIKDCKCRPGEVEDNSSFPPKCVPQTIVEEKVEQIQEKYSDETETTTSYEQEIENIETQEFIDNSINKDLAQSAVEEYVEKLNSDIEINISVEEDIYKNFEQEKFTFKPILDESLENISEEEKVKAKTQITILENFFESTDDQEVEIKWTTEQVLDEIRESEMKVALDDYIKWEDEVSEAKLSGKFKDDEAEKNYKEYKEIEKKLLAELEEKKNWFKLYHKRSAEIMYSDIQMESVEKESSITITSSFSYDLQDDEYKEFFQISALDQHKDQGVAFSNNFYAITYTEKKIEEIENELKNIQTLMINQLEVRKKPNVEGMVREKMLEWEAILASEDENL